MGAVGQKAKSVDAGVDAAAKAAEPDARTPTRLKQITRVNRRWCAPVKWFAKTDPYVIRRQVRRPCSSVDQEYLHLRPRENGVTVGSESIICAPCASRGPPSCRTSGVAPCTVARVRGRLARTVDGSPPGSPPRNPRHTCDDHPPSPPPCRSSDAYTGRVPGASALALFILTQNGLSVTLAGACCALHVGFQI